MVTVSTQQKKRFSTGFDMEAWASEQGYAFRSQANMQLMLAKLLTFPMPTICVVAGHAYAGGLIFAMCHDYKIMLSGSGKLCLSEINIGVVLPPAFANLVTHLMPRQICREMLMGRAILPKEAIKRKLFNAEFQDSKSLMALLKGFQKQFAEKGKKRVVVKEMKEVLHRDAVFQLHAVSTSPFDQIATAQRYKDMEPAEVSPKL